MTFRPFWFHFLSTAFDHLYKLIKRKRDAEHRGSILAFQPAAPGSPAIRLHVTLKSTPHLDRLQPFAGHLDIFNIQPIKHTIIFYKSYFIYSLYTYIETRSYG